MRDEKRRDQRYAINAELRGEALTPVDAVPPDVGTHVRGTVPDISKGGLCLLTNQVLSVSQSLRCEIRVPTLPVWIPTLLNVKWARPNGGDYTYRLGLQFLV